MNWYSLKTLLLCLAFSTLPYAEANDQSAKLPWSPTAEQGRQVGEEVRAVLKRSVIPEAKELLQSLPETNSYNRDSKLSDSKIYFGEWKLAEDGVTLYTTRIRNELIRHRYEIKFTVRAGEFSGSDLVVVTAHGERKAK